MSWPINYPGLNIFPKVSIKSFESISWISCSFKKVHNPSTALFLTTENQIVSFSILTSKNEHTWCTISLSQSMTLGWQIKLLTSMTTLKLVVVGKVRQQNFLLWHSIHYYLGRQYCKIVRCNEKMFITLHTEWPPNLSHKYMGTCGTQYVHPPNMSRNRR